MKKTTRLGAAVLVLAVATGGCAVDTSTSSDHPFSKHGNGKQAKKHAPKTKPDTNGMTTAQANAVRTAGDYLDMEGMSRKGLIDQLKYEGFSAKDATFAADHIKVNWFEEATQSGKDYLKMQGMSRQGLIDQLKYEGFTPQQANYAATQNGL